MIGREILLSEDDVARILSPDHFVAVRRSPGGPAPDVTGAALDVCRARIDEDRRQITARRDILAAAAAHRRAAVDAI